ncbi:hypothetical protein ABZU75_43260 [Streptosporangium sp. NPDC005286]|uniref:hypothetical protein n=1 Tax=Streptosporangium sp. NPDC005286 TaxID=3154463 RepID=UPI0033AE04FE
MRLLKVVLTHAEDDAWAADYQSWTNVVGLTRDMYEAHVALRRFGLIKGVDNESRRLAGRNEYHRKQGLVEPFRFALEDRALDDSATEMIDLALRYTLR